MTAGISTSRLFGLLGILFAIAMAARVTYTIDVVRALEHDYPANPVSIGKPWPTIVSAADEAKRAGLRVGDRVAAIDGRAVEGREDLELALRPKSPGQRLTISAARNGRAEDHRVALRPLVLDSGWLVVGLTSLLMPWLCVALGFWVAAVRPRDPNAWLVLGILLGMIGLTRDSGLDPLGWPGVGLAVQVFNDLSIPLWALCMLLFGCYFPQRWSFDKRAPWFKWVLIVPTCALSAWFAAESAWRSVDYAAVPTFLRPGPAPARALLYLTMVAPSVFFVGLSGTFRDASLPPDSRRRLKLLHWGCTAALCPLFLLFLYMLIFEHGVSGAGDGPALAVALISLILFPVSMAYVLVVQRAMDVRMVVRQGVQYALARRGVRIIQGCIVAGIVASGASLLGPRISQPRRILVISIGVILVLRLRKIGERVRLWVDRRFFREAYNAEQILGDLSEQVRSILDTKTLLETVARKISESLHVERVIVMLQDGGMYRPAMAIGYPTAPDIVFSAGVEKDEARRRLDAQMLLPLASAKEALGFIGLGPKKSEEPYSPSDSSLLRTVAAQTGLALENSRLSESIAHEVAQRELLSREIEIAREVQQRLFPQTNPAVASLQYAGHCRPALGVGGDYYDFLALAGGCLGIAVADISGKGIPAALLMASLQASVRGQSQMSGTGAAALMASVNQLVYDASPANRYATFFYCQFDPATRRLVYTNGGHNAPMLLRGDQVIRLETGGQPVGLFRDARYDQAEIGLEAGDLLILYTDGISEAENDARDEWGEDALIATARGSDGRPPDEMIQRIMQAADAFAAGAPQHDDMTLVVARVS